MDMSVIIPVLNGADILPRQLEALRGQDFAGEWEVIVCDNGSNDDLAAVVGAWQARLHNLNYVDASAVPGAGYARDIGLRAARAPRLATCDADDIVTPEWLRSLDEALDAHAIVAGPIGTIAFADGAGDLAQLLEGVSFSATLPARNGVAYAGSNNSGYRREALSRGYAWDYLIGEDGATCWRAVAAGHSLGWAPGARVVCRDRPTGERSFRRLVSSGVAGHRHDEEFDGRLWDRPRYPLTRGVVWLLLNLPLVATGAGRRRWRFRLATCLGATIEAAAPGLWWGLERRRRARGVRSDYVAAAHA
jgi:glycosyltransferase involved in cell wall biosynthesis